MWWRWKGAWFFLYKLLVGDTVVSWAERCTETIWESHHEERFRVAHKLVNIAFSGYFLHDTLFVVVSEWAWEFVIVHRWSVLLYTPSSCNLWVKTTKCLQLMPYWFCCYFLLTMEEREVVRFWPMLPINFKTYFSPKWHSQKVFPQTWFEPWTSWWIRGENHCPCSPQTWMCLHM